MKEALIGALAATVVCVGAFLLEERFDDDDAEAATAVDIAGSQAPISLRFTDEPAEDSWVSGARGSVGNCSSSSASAVSGWPDWSSTTSSRKAGTRQRRSMRCFAS